MANDYAKLVEISPTFQSGDEIHVLDSSQFSEESLQKLQSDFVGMDIKLLNVDCEGNAMKYALQTCPTVSSFYFLKTIG
jgi:hypothetical protein